MTTTKNNITILGAMVKNWVIPMYGNKHFMPYGTLHVAIVDETDGSQGTIIVKTKGDCIGDKEGYQYVTINRQRYRVITESSMWNPQIKLKPMRKERIDGKLCWVD